MTKKLSDEQKAANKKASDAKWQAANFEKEKLRKAKWQAANPDKVKANYTKWKAANPDKVKASNAEWYATPNGRALNLVAAAKRRAAKKGIEFALYESSIATIAQKIADGRCELTNFAFDLSPTSDFNANPRAPSLDRIDSAKGYAVDNVRVVCAHVNFALGQYGECMFTDLAVNYLSQNGYVVYHESIEPTKKDPSDSGSLPPAIGTIGFTSYSGETTDKRSKRNVH